MDQPGVHQWHALSVDRALAALGATALGLTGEQAAARLAQYGANRLLPSRGHSALERFLLQFHNVLIYVLLASAAVSGALGRWTDAAVILGVVLINALIGYVQEGRAERALEAVRGLLSLHALVLRDGGRRLVPADTVVPGDVVLLASGDKVPADLRLFEVKTLRVDESPLTGESEPVDKSIAPVAGDAAVGDRFCLAYAGTLVTYGQAQGVVVATGAHTEIGRISGLIAGVEEVRTPLLRKMNDFGRWLTYTILGFAAATFAFGVLVRGYTATDMFMAAVALAVAAIPEGLPAVVTITLAIGVRRMAAQRALVRRLPSVETLGSVTVICADKTGTLTRNEMTVQTVVTATHTVQVAGSGYAPAGGFSDARGPLAPDSVPGLIAMARAALLCNDALLHEREGIWSVEGDPTDGALLAFAAKAGLDKTAESRDLPRTDSIPFESEHRFMATLHHDHAGHACCYVKGAPERVLEMCSHQLGAGPEPMAGGMWRDRIDELAAAGQRVIALAYAPARRDQRELSFGDVEHGLTLLGIVGMIDPPREEAIEAIARCREAGIRVKMITGDHMITARTIGSILGIGDGAPAIVGSDLERMDDAALQRVVSGTDVFARASPEHKLRLVHALQGRGEIVAMTGDGVNDAPALKRADVGVAVGPGATEVAREAADIVVTDGNFASIASAVREGRAVFDNIRKFLVFMLPTDAGEAAVVVLAIALGIVLPVTPVQILWVNMVTSVTLGLALAFERPEEGVMRRAPRPPGEPLLSGFLLWRIALVTAFIVAATTGLFMWETARGGTLEAARTVAVNFLVTAEVFYLFNARYLHASSLSAAGIFGNPYVLLAAAAVELLQLVFTYAPPAQAIFGTAAIDATAWLAIIAASALLFFAIEAEKAVRRRVPA